MGELTDKIKGNVNEAIGKAKQQSDNPDTRDEGAGQEVQGKGEQLERDDLTLNQSGIPMRGEV